MLLLQTSHCLLPAFIILIPAMDFDLPVLQKKKTRASNESTSRRQGGRPTSCKVTPPVLHIHMQCVAFTCSFIMEWLQREDQLSPLTLPPVLTLKKKMKMNNNTLSKPQKCPSHRLPDHFPTLKVKTPDSLGAALLPRGTRDRFTELPKVHILLYCLKKKR